MSISGILNSAHINEYANPASRKNASQNNISDELPVKSKTLKLLTSEKISDVVSEKTDQNPNAVDFLRYQATATIANPEQSSRLYNETKKIKNPERQQNQTADSDADEEPEYEIVEEENENENAIEDNLGKGFFITQPFEDDLTSSKLIKKNAAAPLFQKIIDTYKHDDKREVGQLTDLIF